MPSFVATSQTEFGNHRARQTLLPVVNGWRRRNLPARFIGRKKHGCVSETCLDPNYFIETDEVALTTF